MSDVMLCGVLRMPPELWRNDDLQFMQVQSRMLEAADELEKRAIEIEWLRQENAVQNVALIDADDEIKKLEFTAVGLTDAWKVSAAKIERLRAERDTLANWQRNALKEIERLQVELQEGK